MIKETINRISTIIDNYPVFSGAGFLLVAVILTAYQLKKNNSFKMSDYGVLSWRSLVITWGLIVMSLIYGIILIFRNQ